MTIRKRVVYRGRVQGVGFRYTAQRIAEGFLIGGYVKNLPDGTVELVAEGMADFVNQFLASVGSRMGPYIDDQSETELTPEGIQRFQIRY